MRISQRTEKIAFFSKSRLLSEIKPYLLRKERERKRNNETGIEYISLSTSPHPLYYNIVP